MLLEIDETVAVTIDSLEVTPKPFRQSPRERAARHRFRSQRSNRSSTAAIDRCRCGRPRPTRAMQCVIKTDAPGRVGPFAPGFRLQECRTDRIDRMMPPGSSRSPGPRTSRSPMKIRRIGANPGTVLAAGSRRRPPRPHDAPGEIRCPTHAPTRIVLFGASGDLARRR